MIKQDKKKYKIFLAVFGLLVFLNFIGLLEPVNRFLSYGLDFFTFRIRRESNEMINRKQSKEDLLQEIEKLKFELAKEKADSSLLSSLQIENEQFRNFFNFFETTKYKHLLADIVWQDNLLNLSSANQNLIINKGSRDGLYPGLAVVSDSGVMVGKVLEVNDNYSKICLLSNSFCRLAVSLNNEDRSSGLSEGNLGLSLKLSFVAQNEKIDVGNIVFSSGLEKDIPKGLYLGEVVSVEKKENDIWQEIIVEPFYSVSNLNRVAVIIPD